LKRQHFELNYINDKKIAIVSINRPPVNAFTTESYLEIESIIKEVSEDPKTCVIVLNSKARLFSAGADVNELKSNNEKQSAERKSALRRAIKSLHQCRIPLITSVNGAVIGAGAIFASCGDMIIASNDSYFSIPEINIGVVGGAKGLTKIIPPQKVRTLALTGEKINVQDIEKYGGVELITEKRKLEEETINLAKKISDKGALAVRKWKEALLLTDSVGFLEGFYIEQSLSQDLSAFK